MAAAAAAHSQREYSKGERVFFCHPEESWTLGTITEVSTSKKDGNLHSCVADGKASLTAEKLKDMDVHPYVDGSLEDVNDLLRMPYLHDSTLLHQVRKRYFETIIYTHIGPIILALNPFDYTLPNYLDNNMPKYISEGATVLMSDSANLPHTWSVSHQAYWLMRTKNQNQSVIVSGESGAGKTEAAKIVVKYLARVSTNSGAPEALAAAHEVNKRVISTSPIMEAFGNAKTARNDNSSRFGKFMRTQFNRDGLMCGAFMEVYLLEKSRIITHADQERGYHSFYQFLAGASPEEKTRRKVTAAADYKMLNVGNSIVIQGMDDGQDYAEVREAMSLLGMNTFEQDSTFDVVAGILHLNNLVFNEEQVASGEKQAKLDPPHKDNLAFVSNLWGVSPTEMETECSRTIVKAGTDLVPRTLNKHEANDVKEALCKAMYEQAFLQLVFKINSLIDAEAKASNWIGLLDIFGFESFKVNSFEQVCINLANETLQNHYNTCIFTRDMEECQAEGVDTATIVFQDNQPCLDLVTGKLGVMDLLDEECKKRQGSDMDFYDKLVKSKTGHSNFDKPRTEKDVFIIRHYAGDVRYNVLGWRNKNVDMLKPEFRLLMRRSTNAYIANLLDEPEDETRGKKFSTVATFYRQQLGNLMAQINSTNPHWIRCVKPHHAKKPRMFHGTEVMNQLRSAGVLETVRIRKMGYPLRFVFRDFYVQFRIIVDGSLREDPKTGCQRIFDALKLGKAVAQCGHNKVFLKTESYNAVNKRARELLARHALSVQKFLRSLASKRVTACQMRFRHVTVINAFIRSRVSQVVFRKLEYKSREAYLISLAKEVIKLQQGENAARESILSDSNNGFHAISEARRHAAADMEASWWRSKPHRDEEAQRKITSLETSKRSEIVKGHESALVELLEVVRRDFEEQFRKERIRMQAEEIERARRLAEEHERMQKLELARFEEQRNAARALWEQARQHKVAKFRERQQKEERLQKQAVRYRHEMAVLRGEKVKEWNPRADKLARSAPDGTLLATNGSILMPPLQPGGGSGGRSASTFAHLDPMAETHPHYLTPTANRLNGASVPSHLEMYMPPPQPDERIPSAKGLPGGGGGGGGGSGADWRSGSVQWRSGSVGEGNISPTQQNPSSPFRGGAASAAAARRQQPPAPPNLEGPKVKASPDSMGTVDMLKQLKGLRHHPAKSHALSKKMSPWDNRNSLNPNNANWSPPDANTVLLPNKRPVNIEVHRLQDDAHVLQVFGAAVESSPRRIASDQAQGSASARQRSSSPRQK